MDDKTFSLTIKYDGAAFWDGDGAGTEISRILWTLARKIESDPELADAPYILRDYNGNKVGTATIGGGK